MPIFSFRISIVAPGKGMQGLRQKEQHKGQCLWQCRDVGMLNEKQLFSVIIDHNNFL